jgi:hypothetical protein
VSGSRDKTIKLWNTLGECKYTISDPDGHTEWVSCVRFSPVTANPMIVSAGWDKLVKVWNLSNCRLRHNLAGHTGYINTVTVSPDGSLCASGGKVCYSLVAEPSTSSLSHLQSPPPWKHTRARTSARGWPECILQFVTFPPCVLICPPPGGGCVGAQAFWGKRDACSFFWFFCVGGCLVLVGLGLVGLGVLLFFMVAKAPASSCVLCVFGK